MILRSGPARRYLPAAYRDRMAATTSRTMTGGSEQVTNTQTIWATELAMFHGHEVVCATTPQQVPRTARPSSRADAGLNRGAPGNANANGTSNSSHAATHGSGQRCTQSGRWTTLEKRNTSGHAKMTPAESATDNDHHGQDCGSFFIRSRAASCGEGEGARLQAQLKVIPIRTLPCRMRHAARHHEPAGASPCRASPMSSNT